MLSKEYKKLFKFHFLLNSIFALIITVSSYYHIPLNGFNDKFMYFLHLCVLQASFAGFLYFITLNKIVFKVVFSIIFLGLAFLSFWVFSIDISISSSLLNIFTSTKFYIVKDLISFELLLYMLIIVCLLLFILKLYNTVSEKKGIIFFFPTALMLIALFFYVNKTQHRTFSSKLPYSFFYSLVEYVQSEKNSLLKAHSTTTTRNEPIKKVNVLLVIGESLRADHLGINGYNRNTTPLLSKRKNIVSFKNTYTSKGNTLESIPQLLTDQSVYKEHKKDSLTTIFDVLNGFNVSTRWIGNQLLEDTYRSIVKRNEDVVIIDELKSFYSFHKKRDQELLPIFKNKLDFENESLTSIHMIGSHWYYEDKYTSDFKKYQPVTNSKYIPSQSSQQMINSYDNTILYLDYFLNELISIIDTTNEPVVLIYCSDHGESLGENGKWLHAHHDSLTNPGMLVWYSNEFQKCFPKKIDALVDSKEQLKTTDVIFHSVLDLFQINEFEESQSLFRHNN